MFPDGSLVGFANVASATCLSCVRQGRAATGIVGLHAQTAAHPRINIVNAEMRTTCPHTDPLPRVTTLAFIAPGELISVAGLCMIQLSESAHRCRAATFPTTSLTPILKRCERIDVASPWPQWPIKHHANHINLHQCLPRDIFKLFFTPVSRCFSSFPHGTCSLSVSRQYLALDDVYHPLCAALPSNATL